VKVENRAFAETKDPEVHLFRHFDLDRLAFSDSLSRSQEMIKLLENA
jgi:hypothetical protein